MTPTQSDCAVCAKPQSAAMVHASQLVDANFTKYVNQPMCKDCGQLCPECWQPYTRAEIGKPYDSVKGAAAPGPHLVLCRKGPLPDPLAGH